MSRKLGLLVYHDGGGRSVDQKSSTLEKALGRAAMGSPFLFFVNLYN
jgi:hypothetical protein